MLNKTLKRHIAELHALSLEISTYIYIFIYLLITEQR